MPDTLTIVRDADKTFPRQARDRRGVAFTAANSPFLVSDTLECRVWAGDDTQVLATPSVAWDDATTGRFDVTFGPTDTTNLEGIYKGQVTLTRGTQTAVIDEWRIRVTLAPGLGVTPLAFTQLDDLLLYFPTLEDLQGDSSQVGFREEQSRAAFELVDKLCQVFSWGVMTPNAGQPGFMSFVAGGMMGGSSNRWLRDQLVPLAVGSTIPTKWPTRVTTQANFYDATISTALLLHPEVKEMCAKLALARIFRAQISRNTDQDWWKHARYFHADADALFRSRRFEIDLSVPQTGYGSIVIHGGCTSMR